MPPIFCKHQKTSGSRAESEGGRRACGERLGADVSHIHIQTSRKLDTPPSIRSRDREGLVGLLLVSINRMCHTNNGWMCQASVNIFQLPSLRG